MTNIDPRGAVQGLQARAVLPALAGPTPTVPPPMPTRPLTRQARPPRLPRLIGDASTLAATAALVRCIVLPDCSGSEYAANGDTSGIRFAAARALLRLMRITGGGTLGIAHWGTRPVRTLDPLDVTRQFRTIDHVLETDPGNMGGNDFPAALRLAAEMLGPIPPDAIPLVVGVTDGLEPITPAMAHAITALPPGCVHVALVPGTACPPDLAEQWQALPLGSFTRLPGDNQQLAHTIGAVYAAAVGGVLPAPAPRRTPRILHTLRSSR